MTRPTTNSSFKSKKKPKTQTTKVGSKICAMITIQKKILIQWLVIMIFQHKSTQFCTIQHKFAQLRTQPANISKPKPRKQLKTQTKNFVRTNIIKNKKKINENCKDLLAN